MHTDHANLESIVREAQRQQERQERACPRVCRLNEALLPIRVRMDYRDRHAVEAILDDVNHELLHRLDMADDVTAEEEAQVLAGLDWVRQEIA